MKITKKIPLTICINYKNECSVNCQYYQDTWVGSYCDLFSKLMRKQIRCKECKDKFGNKGIK